MWYSLSSVVTAPSVRHGKLERHLFGYIHHNRGKPSYTIETAINNQPVTAEAPTVIVTPGQANMTNSLVSLAQSAWR